MSRFGAVRLVAAREVRTRLRSRAFIVSTLISLALVLALAVLPGILAGDDSTTYRVGVTGERAGSLAAVLPAIGRSLSGDVTVEVSDVDDRAAGQRALAAGDLDAVVVDGRQIVVDDELGDELGALLQVANRVVATSAALEEAGVTPEQAAAVLETEPLQVAALDPRDQEERDREGIVFAGSVLLYGQLLGFGFWVATGVVEEKSSRVVELLLAKTRPWELLTGKILGIGAVGFVQLVAFVGLGLGAAQLSGTVDLPAGTAQTAFEVLAWFVLGFVLYSCMFAVGGALASRAEEMQTTTMPITLVAMASFFAALFAGSEPGGTLARVATFIPPSAPMVLPIRTSAGEIEAWEVAGGIAVVLVAIVLTVRIAARAYAGAAMNLRGQLSLRQALARGRGRRAVS